MQTQPPVIKSLLQMGFSQTMAFAAYYKNSKSENLQLLINWISQNEDKQQQLGIQLSQGIQSMGQSNQQTISSMVIQQEVRQLMSLGYSKHVAQKSLFLTNNKGINQAKKWIQQHKIDPDFEEQLFIVGKQQSTLTDQQAKQKARQLQLKIREDRKKRQEQEQFQRQKNRIKGGKQMTQAKRELDQHQKKRDLQAQHRQRLKDEQYKRQLLEKMERQKADRFGKKYNQATKKIQKQKQLNEYQTFEVYLEQIKIGSPIHLYPGKAKQTYQTILTYINNILKNNGDQKFRRINMSNKAFESRIMQTIGGIQCLNNLGFVEQNGFLTMKTYKKQFLMKIIPLLQKYIKMTQ